MNPYVLTGAAVVAMVLVGVAKLHFDADRAREQELADAQAAIATQNAKIEAAAAAAVAIENTARAGAARELARGARAAARIPTAGHGPEEMNRWLSATFAE